MSDTIVAQATPPGRGSIGVVRISGPLTTTIARKILKKIPEPRRVCFGNFFDMEENIIDQGIALFFSAPNSFTGEDVLELQGHGGPIVIDNLINTIVQHGARIAKPGEFSERAFINEKIDLAQAEAIADLINAQSAQAAQQAVRSLQGAFSKYISELQEKVINLRMYVEAAIDFPDEEINFLSDGKIATMLNNILQQIENLLTQTRQGSVLNEGIKVVIAGKPNVGKSSLINQLSGKEIAIVTDIPGTTRDVIREHIQLAGLILEIIDTAGIHTTTDHIEQEGITRAINEINSADCLLIVTDITENLSLDDILSSFEKQIKIDPKKIIIVRNKLDLKSSSRDSIAGSSHIIVNLSAKTGEGIETLLQELKNLLGLQQTNEGQFIARRRHVVALMQAKDYLLKAQQMFAAKAPELVAEELGGVQKSLDEITGKFHNDELLGKIFSSFCIGK